MRQLTFRRRPSPVVIGGGLVAVSVIAASCVAALSSGQDRGNIGAAATHTAAHAAAGSTGSTGTADAGNAASLAGSVPSTLSLPVPGSASSVSSAANQSATDTSSQQPSAAGASVPRLVVPDVIAAVPGGVTQADVAKLRKLSQVRTVLAISGARITVNGTQLTVLGAPAGALRPWTPPETAVSQRVWSDFAAGDLITTATGAQAMRLVSGRQYPVTARVRTRVTFGTGALLGISGVGAIVNQTRARQLGLVRNVAVLINAPAADMTTLVAQVSKALGAGSQVVRLVPVTVSTSLPVDKNPPKGKPASYLALFQESAAQYCPGLSWTVLAAIGQIESGDGANEGPSTAGALGPMQFLPSTWQAWGIDGFGDTGSPNIMSPFDAVPSAARLLCADGAAQGGQALSQAIFDYNHASWYVDEVLTLADEYAREFG
ncbi:MAG TPA: lytic transglycosylase domain-containing protein [Trebonia sp.]|nr:lytic transglycosylase domain-containing protein [Trebonia sp.]